MKVFQAVCRLLANHCIELHVRMLLFRLSGIRIGRGARFLMGVNLIDSYEKGMIEVGKNAAISANVSIITLSDPTNSPLTGYGVGKEGKVVVGAGTWVGAGAVIMPGVTIGDNAIIGANAVVTRDVPPYAVAVGVPAKVVRDVRDTPCAGGGKG